MRQQVARTSGASRAKRTPPPPADNEAAVSAALGAINTNTRDARIAIGLPNHHKTKRLIRLLGDAGGWYLIKLWLWAAANKPAGNLAGMSDDDIELAVDWPGDEGAFIGALLRVRFLSGEVSSRQIHDWADHNPWLASFPARQVKAKFAAICKHHSRAYAERAMPHYASTLPARSPTLAEQKSMDFPATGMPLAESGSAPSPIPIPLPLKERASRARYTEPHRGSLVAESAVRACQLMKAAGCVRFNASHPDLAAVIEAGGTPEMLGDAAAEAVAAKRTHPFAWAIAAVRGRLADGPTPTHTGASHGHAHDRRRGESLADYSQRINAAHDAREHDDGD